MAMPTRYPGSVQETAFSPPNEPSAPSQQLPISEPSTRNGPPSAPSSHANGEAAPLPPTTRLVAPDLLRGLLMAFMAMDHNIFAVRSWSHGLGRHTESSGFVVRRWNRTLALVTRELSHLCAPGFVLLLGMGIVLLVQSRRKKGWTTPMLVKHVTIRGFVLLVVAVVFGWIASMGRAWLMNGVLVALAVVYFLGGLLWLGLEHIEGALAKALDKVIPDATETEDAERAPLLQGQVSRNHGSKPWALSADALAHHAGTAFLVVLFFVTLWWNIWLDPSHGVCPPESEYNPQPPLQDSQPGDFWRFWFYVIERARVMSTFPPLAWLSPAILGLLYGRLVFMRSRSFPTRKLTAINATLGAVFAVLFVLTRLLHFGNLTEDCLRIDGQPLEPGQNQYLQSAIAFFYSSKYPPDPAFIFYSLSGNFFLLSLFGAIPAAFSVKWLKPLLAFGQSALFYYFVHIFVIVGFGAVWIAIGGHEVDLEGPEFPGDHFGMDQWWAYWGNWTLAMAALWPLCKWYGNFKHTKGPDSLWRFF